ncbi:FG-GAP repeat domain-containing protein, partial [Fodinibius sp.]|uniref:FG-GAP repeat domain-containing protein n=1 Tax=Fodinibius sp. TaxID=1872440 RepID=UPI003568824A
MNIPTGRRYLFFIIVGISITVLFIYLSDNAHIAEVEKHFFPGNTTAFDEGKILSEKYCSRCHLYPEPSLLPKQTWTSSVLPAMGPLLGIYKHKFETYPTETDPNLPRDYYPSEQQISSTEWQKILDYYEQAAPGEFNARKKKQEILDDNFIFKARTPELGTKNAPKVTSVRFDTCNQLIYAADANLKKFLTFNNDLELLHTFASPTPISDIRIGNTDNDVLGKQELLLTFIGRLLPTDAPAGSVKNILYNPLSTELISDSLLLDDLARPVESKWADLNQDGLDDLLISEFGHRTGKLFWVENTGKKLAGQKSILLDTPGCIQTDIRDINGNGLQDIIALCTQTDQAIYLFENQGEGNFLKTTLLQFQITAGSSSFEIHDFNSDGYPDILYTSGDNADYSTIFKPYHGVYIFLNDGKYNFTKEWFYPLHGAYDAQAHDFNNDGRLDIAVIAFYADYENHPEEGFVLFKNEGNLKFIPYHHPDASAGRWITMDIADWNDDGNKDILLGNFSEGSF